MDINYDITVDVDSLFDTRLGMLYDLDTTLASKLITNGKYKKREFDEFGYMSKSVFNKVYSQRTKHVLDLGLQTSIFKLIKEYIFNSNSLIKQHGGSIKLNLFTNVYNFTEKEKALLQHSLEVDLNLEVVILDSKQLKLSDVYDTGLLVLYRGMEWLEWNIYTTDLISKPMYDLTLITPKNKKIKDKELFNKLEDIYKIMIDLKFVELEVFSSR